LQLLQPGGRGGLIQNGWGCLVYLIGVKKAVLVVLRVPASKGPQRELLQYLLRVLSKKKKKWHEIFEIQLIYFLVSELVPLRGEKNFKPHSQNRILVPLRGSFQNYRRASPSFLYESSPPRLLHQVSSKKFPKKLPLLIGQVDRQNLFALLENPLALGYQTGLSVHTEYHKWTMSWSTLLFRQLPHSHIFARNSYRVHKDHGKAGKLRNLVTFGSFKVMEKQHAKSENILIYFFLFFFYLPHKQKEN